MPSLQIAVQFGVRLWEKGGKGLPGAEHVLAGKDPYRHAEARRAKAFSVVRS